MLVMMMTAMTAMTTMNLKNCNRNTKTNFNNLILYYFNSMLNYIEMICNLIFFKVVDSTNKDFFLVG